MTRPRPPFSIYEADHYSLNAYVLTIRDADNLMWIRAEGHKDKKEVLISALRKFIATGVFVDIDTCAFDVMTRNWILSPHLSISLGFEIRYVKKPDWVLHLRTGAVSKIYRYPTITMALSDIKIRIRNLISSNPLEALNAQ